MIIDWGHLRSSGSEALILTTDMPQELIEKVLNTDLHFRNLSNGMIIIEPDRFGQCPTRLCVGIPLKLVQMACFGSVLFKLAKVECEYRKEH